MNFQLIRIKYNIKCLSFVLRFEYRKRKKKYFVILYYISFEAISELISVYICQREVDIQIYSSYISFKNHNRIICQQLTSVFNVKNNDMIFLLSILKILFLKEKENDRNVSLVQKLIL